MCKVAAASPEEASERPDMQTAVSWTSRASQVAMVGKNLPTSAGDVRDKGSSLGWENLLEGAWKPTPVFLPGKFHEQRTLAGYSP